MRKLKAVLSTKSLTQLSKDFNTHITNLYQKQQLFVARLAQIGIPVIEQNVASAKGDSSRNVAAYVEVVDSSETHYSVKLVASNQDILFIEFGAGIYYNNGNNHPQASELGYGIGSYPGQIHAINPGYWWYKGDDGGLHFSLGTEATMPVYKAYREMIDNVGTIAREVFGDG